MGLQPEHIGIGKRVCAVRRHSKLSQRRFAARLKISPSYLSAVERGADKVNIDIILGISSEFPETDIAWLITGDPSAIRYVKQQIADELTAGLRELFDMRGICKALEALEVIANKATLIRNVLTKAPG